MSAGTELCIEPCEDARLLAGLFLELAEDEQSDIKRTREKAFEEMLSFLERGERAYTFLSQGKVAGYALVNTERTPPYLHHFYICREDRRRGYGSAAFHLLLKAIGANEMDLDVYVWNERGNAFWSSFGFKPRATIMRYEK